MTEDTKAKPANFGFDADFDNILSSKNKTTHEE